MRSAPFFAIIALGVVAVAKEPTPAPVSRSSQIVGPHDPKKEFNMEQLTPFGRSKSEFRARGAQTDSFYIQQKYQPKGYTNTKDFRTKSAYDGNFKFATKDARTKTFETKTAATDKTAAVKDARDSNKSAATREYPQANRTSAFKGRNQALFDKEGPAAQAKIGPAWAGNLKELTENDVREILNKNK